MAATSSPWLVAPPGCRGSSPRTSRLSNSKHASTGHSSPAGSGSSVTGSSRGHGCRCAAVSGSPGACARLRPLRPRTGRTGPLSRWDCSTKTGQHPGSRPSNRPTRGTAGDPPHLLATEFTLTVPVRSARLYATALGLYTAAVNGERVGTAELSPGSTSYDRTLYAQASDVTESLRLGANRLELELSDGWYRGQVGAFRMPAGWGTVLGLRVELHIEHTDGTRTIVRSDDTWTSRRSSTVRADLMDGQTVDFTAGEGDPAPVRLGAVDAPGDRLVAGAARACGGIARSSVDSRDRSRGYGCVDFGQNASGWIRLTDLGPEGTTHCDRLRRARRPRRRPLHLPLGLRAAGRTAGALPAARRGGRRYAQRGVRAPPHGPWIPVRAPDASRRSSWIRRASRCRSCTPTSAGPAPSPAATMISTGCTRSPSGASAATPWTCRPTARPGSVWPGPATTRSSRRRRRGSTTCSGSAGSGCGPYATTSSTTAASRTSRRTGVASSSTSTISSR